jgi:ClpP class serine protease
MRRARYSPRHAGILAVTAGSFGVEFDAPENARPFETSGTVAIVDIRGPIMQHADWCWDSYDAITARVAAAFASNCTAVILRIDSPGGDALGCFEATREMRQLAETSKKPLYAYADGMIASAAYALACAAQMIFVPPAGFVGSVGVLKPLVDATAMDRAMGLNFTMIASGSRKLDGNPHVHTSDAAIAETQAQVDSLAELFFALVADMRPGVSADEVRGLQAALFHGEKAVSAKLADRVVTFNELLAMVASGNAKALSAGAEIAMNYKELRAALEKMAEGDGEEADKAKKALAAMDQGDKPADGDKEKPKEAAAADEPPPAPAPEKKKDGEDEGAKALVAVTAKVHSLEAKLAAKEDAEARAQLFAQRPDFSAETKATLAKAPLDMVREAVEKWPRIISPAAAASVQGTAGAGQAAEEAARTAQLPTKEKAELDDRMGLAKRGTPIRREGRALVFGAMSAEDARGIVALKATNGGGR